MTVKAAAPVPEPVQGGVKALNRFERVIVNKYVAGDIPLDTAECSLSNPTDVKLLMRIVDEIMRAIDRASRLDAGDVQVLVDETFAKYGW